MVRGLAAVLLVSSLCALTACNAKPRSTTSASATAGGEAPGSAASGDRRRSERRQLTWEEYYVEVEQRTRHAGGMVMWFNPPRLERRPCTDPSEPAIQPSGGSVSDSVH